MKKDSVRTTVDLPAVVYRRLKEQAAAEGCSVRELILRGVERVLVRVGREANRRVTFPLIHAKGPKVRVPQEKIYEYVEFS